MAKSSGWLRIKEHADKLAEALFTKSAKIMSPKNTANVSKVRQQMSKQPHPQKSAPPYLGYPIKIPGITMTLDD